MAAASMHLWVRRLMLRQQGQPMTLSRTVHGAGPGLVTIDVTVMGFVSQYLPQGDLTDTRQATQVGVVRIGDEQCEILNDEIEREGWPGPPIRNDHLTFDGHTRIIKSVMNVNDGRLLIGWKLWLLS